MPIPAQAVHILVPLVAQYIGSQRSKYSESGEVLPEIQRERLSVFFPVDALAACRFAQARPRLLDPPFYRQARALGIRSLPDLAKMAAITFVDVVVYQVPLSERTIFHELVHVMQYRRLGLEGFAHRYAKGFLESGSYEAIPLEEQAYALDARFAKGETFSVEEEVEAAVASGSL